MFAESLTRAFWPFWSVLFVTLALLMLGLHDSARVEVVWAGGVIAVLAALGTLVWGIRAFRWPDRTAALDRLDATLPNRPIAALLDHQAIGGSDAASVAVWEAHRRRMYARLDDARPVQPDLRVSRRDPFALRYVALLAFLTALMFGSIWRVGSVTEMTPGGGTALATGPAWEGWAEPPAYTRLPTLYLNDQPPGVLSLPEGSTITLRLYGEVGALTVTETVSGRTEEVGSVAAPSQAFTVEGDGTIEIAGEGGRSWSVTVTPDTAPGVIISGQAEVGAEGEMTMPFTAWDDYGVQSGEARITLDLAAVDRRHGLALDPEPVEVITVPLPMPINGQRQDFEETLIEDFSLHPWANLPVKIELTVVDEAGQEATGVAETQVLPGRRFFDPLARAISEQRRDLLWNRANMPRIAQLMRAISHRPDEGLFRKEAAYLQHRVILRRIEAAGPAMDDTTRDELAQALWDLALLIEEGDLEDAMERLQRAQDRLSEAMRNGASDQEIAELMQELREATDDYLRQLSRQAQQDGQQGDQPQQQQGGESMQMTQNDLQQMMDRIQELMEQGRMAEAQEALDQLRQMMENMRVTEGQQGQQGQSPGQQAMEGLGETLREQQGLSDQAFRDLQEQFGQGQQGQSQQNQGRNGGMGQGQQHDQQGQGGQPGQGQGEGQDQAESQPGQGQGDGDLEQSLADRQRDLRNELNRQRQNLPGGGTEQGEEARRSLERAEGAMDGAEDALREGDMAEAIDRQSEAMEALREGIRNLGEAMAQEQRNQGQQGDAQNNAQAGQRRDPLGRNPGSNGQVGTEEQLLQGEDVYRRARDLLDEIRRRSGESDRPDVELDYLKRLLDRF
nr:TIGR02302 family protein [Mesobacterium pallidum]